MCHRLADLESMGTEPTELSGTASLELGEVSSDAAGEETSSSSYLSILSLLDPLKSPDPSTLAGPWKLYSRQC